MICSLILLKEVYVHLNIFRNLCLIRLLVCSGFHQLRLHSTTIYFICKFKLINFIEKLFNLCGHLLIFVFELLVLIEQLNVFFGSLLNQLT